jgi:hypothetical protein
MEVNEMKILDDELGVGGYGPFAYPNGVPIVSTEEVERIKNKFDKE